MSQPIPEGAALHLGSAARRPAKEQTGVHSACRKGESKVSAELRPRAAPARCRSPEELSICFLQDSSGFDECSARFR